MPPETAVAIVGAGGMAREHIRAFAAVPGVRVAGISSRTRSKAEALAAEFDIPVVTHRVDELHARTQASLVVVTVSVEAVEEVATAALAHPWALLLEKPPAVTSEETARLASQAERAGRLVMVALNRRHLSSTRAMIEGLDAHQGARFITVSDQQSLDSARAGGHPEHVVRNYMYANSIHVIDLLAFAGRGDVTDVTVIEPWREARPSVVAAAVTFASGDRALYHAVWNAPGPWAVAVSVAGHRYEMRPLERATHQVPGSPPRELPVDESDLTFKPGFRRQAEAAVRAAAGEASAIPRLSDALRTMDLIRRIYGLSQ